ncbi:MAG: hypothetical protein ABMA64_27545 [Myxococcota bacterium]
MERAYKQHNLAQDQLHSELVSRNIFRITMVGAVAFLAACAWVMAH